MGNSDKPTVTVAVITYNSSKTVVETLDSVLAQTYPNLELIVSDDASTDNTVHICRNWIEKNRDRFLDTQLLTVEKNTGVSANMNRAWDACKTKWLKDIAGDDLLFPRCIEENIAYVGEHPDTVIVFSRAKIFESRGRKKVWLRETWHDYGFFNLSQEEQYHYLIYHGNKLPASSCFYNLNRLKELDIRNDERIPLLEDYPKWLMLARKKVRFDYFNSSTVGYRHDSSSLSAGIYSPAFFKSNLLFYLYYFPDEINQENQKEVIYNLICDNAVLYYRTPVNEVAKLRNSWDFRIGHFIMAPFHFLKDNFNL